MAIVLKQTGVAAQDVEITEHIAWEMATRGLRSVESIVEAVLASTLERLALCQNNELEYSRAVEMQRE
jgi:vacuolar-type H+-ATPase subunit E/Vma4